MTVKKADDKAFVTDLLGIFEVMSEDTDVEKMFRLGCWEDGKMRPLLVTFKNLEQKETVMANLRKLKERTTTGKFQNIGIAHDFSPKERQQIKDMVNDAKHEHAASNTDRAENYRFLVVGRGRGEKSSK